MPVRRTMRGLRRAVGVECGVRSPTQCDLGVADIAALVRTGLGAGVTDAAELTGGGFATVWRASLTDGRDVVVKVGPAPGARLLGYEDGLIAAEAEYFRLVGDRAPAHLYVLMLAEGPSRGIGAGGDRHEFLTRLLTEELDRIC
jgi:hypothetical protein